MSILKNLSTQDKAGIVITIFIIVIGSALYFGLDIYTKNNMKNDMSVEADIYKEILLKTAFSPEGSVKIFANVNENYLKDIELIEGDKKLDDNLVMLGFEEAKMMREEDLFNVAGDKIEGLFGINATISAILKKTDSPIDDFHFVNKETFEKIEGDKDKLFILLNEENMPKLFYTYSREDSLLKISLDEGIIEDYKTVTIDGKIFYPLIIGSKEADMMRSEKLFESAGDKIEGLFEHNFIVVGVLEKTNSPLDMMHFISLDKEDLKT